MGGNKIRRHELIKIGILFIFLTGFDSSSAARVTGVSNNHGSLNGETRLTIHGQSFSADQYSGGNTVKLVSNTRVYDCPVQQYGTTESKIICYTPQGLIEGTYNVTVAVDGNQIPEENHCSSSCSSCCKFYAQYNWYTPTINQIEPITQSGLPGGFLKLTGRIMSNVYGSNVQSTESYYPSSYKIVRVYAAAQLCELKGENDTLYGLQGNYWWAVGYIKCLMSGKFIGNSNASFIIDPLGRSKTNPKLLRVSSNDEIYTFQTYAQVTGVSPSSGSVQGGTLLTIYGQYFDDRTPVKVMVGGTMCEVTKTITDKSIECETAAQLSVPRYTGNRGLNVDLFKEKTYYSLTELSEIFTLNSSSSDSNITFVDHFFYIDTINGRFSLRLHGFFVPPHSGDYTLHIMCDRVAILYFSMDDNPESKTQIASCSGYTSSYSRSEQTSEVFHLQKGKNFYIEAVHSGSSYVKVAAQHKQTKFTNAMTGLAVQEKQRIRIALSDVKKEVQTVTVHNFDSGITSTNEIQEVTIIENFGTYSDATYRIGLYGVYTQPLKSFTAVTEIEEAMNGLPFLDDSESVSVSSKTLEIGGTGTVLIVQFKSERGAFPVLDIITIPGLNGETLNVSVALIQQGVASGNYFTLHMEGVPSPLIPLNATNSQFQATIESLFSTRCSKMLSNPEGASVLYNADPDYHYGSRTNEVEPFCGRYVLKNPSYLYYSYPNGFKLSSRVAKLCFAYQGNQIQNRIRFYAYIEISGGRSYDYTDIRVTLQNTTGWHYFCMDMLEEKNKMHVHLKVDNDIWIRYIELYKLESAEAFYIDDIYIGQKAPIANVSDVNSYRMPPPRPNNALVRSVSVTSRNEGEYEITLSPYRCGYNFTLFYTTPGQIPLNGSVSVERLKAASPPITGTFMVTFNGTTKKGFSYDMDEIELKEMLETIDGIGGLTVTRTDECYYLYTTITFDTLPGDQPEFQVESTEYYGRDIQTVVDTLEEGGMWYDPIPGDMLRTDHDKPQVMAYINGIPTICSGDCSFEWNEDMTPIITKVTPTSGPPGTSIVISGTKLGAKAADNHVTIGGVSCILTTGDENSVTCTTGQGSYGSHMVEVFVKDKGKASNEGGSVTFQYQMGVQSIHPTSGTIGGWIPLTIAGNGFNEESTVTVGGKSCPVTNSNFTDIICMLPSSAEGAVDIIVTINGKSVTSPIKYTYKSAQVSIYGIEPTIVNVAGGSVLTINGTNFGTSGILKIGTAVVTTDVFTDSQIIATLPSLPPGTYDLFLYIDDKGAVVNRLGEIPTIEYELQVTNVFPRRASLYGGTRFTLSGQGFSSNTSLIEVKVGNYGCNVESATETEIVCLLDEAADIIKIDNQGVHPTWGKGYQWNPVLARAKVGDIVEWTWTTPSWVLSFTHRVEQTKSETSIEQAPDGFISGPTGTANGKFRYKMTKPGEYPYWSGYTDKYEIVYYRGMLVVENKTSFVGEVEVKIAGHVAQHVIADVINPVDNSKCPGITDTVSDCASSIIDQGKSELIVVFDACHSPIVTSLNKNQGTTSDKIVISGSGFSETACNNEVMFGEDTCTVTNATKSELECYINPTDSPTIGLMQDISVRVNNLGNALIAIAGQSAKTFVLKPLVTRMRPSTSSLNGGALLTIIGSGYQGSEANIYVSINSFECKIQTVKYTEIVCVTPPSQAGKQTIEVIVRTNGLNIPTVCDIACQLVYDSASTPEVTDVSPDVLTGALTSITITGNGYDEEIDKTEVKIGGVDCSLTFVNDTEITCEITHVPAGSQNVEVFITNKGKATALNNVITGSTVISSVLPSEGSIHGGTEVTIQGNGFVDGSTSVTIGGSTCNLEKVTLSHVICKTSAHVAEKVTLNVISNGQNYGPKEYEYSNSMTPAITSVAPSTGTKGTTVVIVGFNFGTSSGDNLVKTGGEPCNVTSFSETEIQCIVGVHSIGKTPVIVDVKSKGLSNDDIFFEFEMTVDTISKTSGSLAGGQTVTISGSGFDDTTSVTICGKPCRVDDTAMQTASQFVCVTPSTTDTSNSPCDVVVTVDGVQKTLTGGYTYMKNLTATITNISPNRGGTGGGVMITVTGTGFGSDQNKVSVTIAGTICDISTVTDTEITCVTRQHSPSQKTSVRVEIDGNGMAEQTNAEFFYIDVWSSPFTWGGGSPPEDGSLVVIPKGHIILLDQNTTRLKMVLIKGGELIFDEKDIELFADNILIVEGGKLQIGTESQPFQHKAVITGTAHLRSKELPVYGTNSIGVREGVLDLHGMPLSVVWSRLSDTADVGSKVIILQHEVDWLVGSKIVIATTGHRHTQKESEVHTIASIGADRRTITLVETLKYKHLGEGETIGGHYLKYQAEVGLLTRNIVLRGERDPQWTESIEACPNGFDTGQFATQTCFQGRFGDEMGSDQFGIQVMIHPQEPNKDLAIARVSYVEFTYAGQAFRVGRYPFHFHLAGDMKTSYIKGCALHETFNRAITIHGSQNIVVENNVVYNVMGNAFFLEDGTETGNRLQYNLAIFVRESSSLLNDDITPASFWITNPKNYIEHNAAAGGSHFGFWYRMSNSCQQRAILSAFNNNTAHSFGWYGLWIYEYYYPRQNGNCYGSPSPALFRNFYAWNCDKGSEIVNSGAVQFHNFTLVNNRLVGHQHTRSSEGECYTENSPMFKNGLIVGRSPVLSSTTQGCTRSGVMLPRDYRYIVDGTQFANFDEKECVALRVTSHVDRGYVHHTKNLIFTKVGAKNKGAFHSENEAIIYDVDGTLTGTPQGTVVPMSNVLPASCSYFEGFSGGVNASLCPPGTRFLRLFLDDNYVTFRTERILIIPANGTFHLDLDYSDPTPDMEFTGTLGLYNDYDFVIFTIESGKKPDRVLIDSKPFANATSKELNGITGYHGDWTYNETSGILSFLISKKTRPDVNDRRKRAASDSLCQTINFHFKSYKCAYENCIPPPDLDTIPPPSSITPHYANCFWPGAFPPRPCTNVTIPPEQWCIVDRNPQPLGNLIIYGVLQFESGSPTTGYPNFVLKVANIVILGGRLIIGVEEKTFLGNINIILQSDCFNGDYILPGDGTNIGSKVIAVYGGLDLHGKRVSTPWTTLNATVQPGERTLTVNGDVDVDWSYGNEIVVAPTGYSTWETETFQIRDISRSNNQTVLSLNTTLKYRHLAYEDNNVRLTAEVGLLTRNIKIQGGDYPGLMNDMKGGHILVGESSIGRGYARISNTEFYHMGQYVDTKVHNPRYAILYQDSRPNSYLRPSFVNNSAFHHGFAPAIGIYNVHNIPVQDNVFHHSINFAIETDSYKTQLKRNMVTLTVWEGTYRENKRILNNRYDGAISASVAVDLTLEGNRVSGSERVAYQLRLHSCDMPPSESYLDNVARTSLIGVATFPSHSNADHSCNRISGFLIWKCSDFGIYYQNEKSVLFEELTFADNQVAIFPFIIGPDAKAHQFASKHVTIRNVTITGTTSSFDCSKDKVNDDVNIRFAGNSHSFDLTRRVGITFGTFSSTGNNVPKGSFPSISSYPAIKGITVLQDVTFRRFSRTCSTNDYAITTNSQNDDGSHPLKSSGLVFEDVPKENRILIHRPNLGKINPSDCVDMDCDGLKKAFLKDLDGSFLGSPGTVIPQSEWEWDGDPRRGLGDYRVPKTMQTDLDGNRIPMETLAPIKGVIRDKGCVYVSGWNAYECHAFDYEMLVIESMDSDTETRRLSPVAILGHDEEDDGVIDLINGPQDHGWCSGYTCRKRLSTFQAIVGTGKEYLIHFTGTTPQKLRYFLLNSHDTQAVCLQVWYSQPYRLDVYHKDSFVMPKNGRWKFGAYILDPPPIGQPLAYKPNVTNDHAGTNWFDRESGILYFLLRGPGEINVKTVAQVIISFKYPAMTVNDFYGEKIVEYLADFFDLPPEKVRVVNIVSAQQSSGRRRKRSAEYDVIVVEISDGPSDTLNGTTSSPLTLEKLQAIYAAAMAEGQLGNFSAILNATVLGVSVAQPPFDPSDPAWATVTTSDGYIVIVPVHHLGFYSKPKPLHEGAAFTTQPKINAFDVFGIRIDNLGTSEHPWYLTASLRPGTGFPEADLLGNTTIKFVKGWANFTNLAISYYGYGYIIDFNITSPAEGENMTLTSDPLNITFRQITAGIVTTTPNVYESVFMSVGIELKDSVTKETISDIAWRGYSWNVTAEMRNTDFYNGTLDGMTSVIFDNVTGQANFYSLKLTNPGFAIVKFHVMSNPSGYDFNIEHVVSVKGRQFQNTVPEETSDIVLKIDADYDSVVGSDDKYLVAMLGNWFATNYPDLGFDALTVSPGSIMVSLTVSGSSDIISSTLDSMCSLISDGQTFNYSGTPLVLSPYMNYNGSTFYGVSCNVVPEESLDSSSGGSMVAIIVGVCVGILVLIAIIIVILVWKLKASPKIKINDLPDYKYGMNFPEKTDNHNMKFQGNNLMRPASARSNALMRPTSARSNTLMRPTSAESNAHMRPTSAGSINTSLLFRGNSFTSANLLEGKSMNDIFTTEDSCMRTASCEKNELKNISVREAFIRDGTSLAGNDDMKDILFRERTDLGINTPPTNTFNI